MLRGAPQAAFEKYKLSSSLLKVYHNLSEFSPLSRAVVTVGTFDGVHKGHQILLDRIKAIAAEGNAESVLLTFNPHPRLVLFPEQNDLKLLTSLEEKIALLEKSGINHLIVHPFTREFSRTTALEYVRDILVAGIGVHKLVIGYDHHFGRNREGSLDNLRLIAPDYDFDVEEIPAQMIDDVNVSSTKVRNALLEGDVVRANDFLGYPYSLSGEVVRGNEIGRSIGFPTANLKPIYTHKLVPGNGVYAVTVQFDDRVYHGIANVGKRPTIARGEDHATIEAHLFNFSSDLYGKILEVNFHARIRSEIKFDNIEALKAQIEKDAVVARNLLNSNTLLARS